MPSNVVSIGTTANIGVLLIHKFGGVWEPWNGLLDPAAKQIVTEGLSRKRFPAHLPRVSSSDPFLRVKHPRRQYFWTNSSRRPQGRKRLDLLRDLLADPNRLSPAAESHDGNAAMTMQIRKLKAVPPPEGA